MSKQMAASNPTADERMQRRRRLGDRIRTLRMQAGLTQGDLGSKLANTSAGDMPVPQTTISRWETGAVEIVPDQIFALEQVLGVETGDLLAYAGYAKKTVKASASVEDLIAHDNRLPPAMRDDAIMMYQTFLRHAAEKKEVEDRFERLGGKAATTSRRSRAAS